MQKKKQVIIVLDQANLEIFKVGKSRDARYQLLNCDDHFNLLKKLGRDPADYRPDITHQCLLTLLDSPLNKSGHLKLFIRTRNNTLIEISPQIRIPRTFPRFAGLIAELLQKLSVRSSDTQQKLMSVIKNPLSDHLPVGAKKIGFSDQGAIVKIRDYVRTLALKANHASPSLSKKEAPENDTAFLDEDELQMPVVLFIGAMAHGSDDFGDIEEKISVSQYPLSASVACAKVCCAFEDLWNIV